MPHRIEVKSEIVDTRAEVIKKKLKSQGFSVEDIQLVDVYTIKAELSSPKLEQIASMLSNPVTEKATIKKHQAPARFNWAIEMGFLPGVTDNVANTAKEGIEDLLKTKFDRQAVASSQLMFVTGDLCREDANAIGNNLANSLIERIHIKNYDEFIANNGMDVIFPEVKLDTQPTADVVDILNATDEELIIIGKQGIANADGTRRGPLALSLTYMKAMQTYFQKKGRNPTDVELESIAQTWSEHCKHTIFADPLDEITEGIFKTYIKGATNRIRKEKGEKDFCVSVFTDNAGIMEFDEDYNITLKIETHNSPSALDPFGGAITGIVGVNRDPMGTGLGSKPFINISGPFCFANPEKDSTLYKGANKTQKMLSSRRIMDGVIEGVRVGGNCSGIPTSHFKLIFDERYRGKPLVYVGTGGSMLKKVCGKPSHEKQAKPGDYIVMTGGRVGQDGIHGATFSSEVMDAGSPATAVQIGDPITQKKLSDALVKEARDLGLYNSITDNGAGGLSCSVAEMAEECNGCYVKLDDVPLKYPGLEPWKIWISESQERMTLAVPKEKLKQFLKLMEKRGVEATVIGEFTDSGQCVVEYNNRIVMSVDMDFLHHGLPPRPMKTTYTKVKYEEPAIPKLEDLTKSLHSMLSRQNIASFEFISQQYDHEVQGGSAIKPLQGRGRINGDATVTRPVLSSKKGVIIAQGINPSYSDIDTYHMAACAIDTAVRNAVAAGADLEQLALLDNFCWCSSDEPEKLGQLKEAAKACYDYSVAYGTPFISGKDSMFNDFKGYDEDGKPIKISVPPTLLATSIGVMKDAKKAVSLDAKIEGDLVYVLGETHDELGGSEYFAMTGEEQRGEKYIGNNVPKVDAEKNKKLYKALQKSIDKGVVASAQSIHQGGLAVALAKTAMGGNLGVSVSLEKLPGTATRDDFKLYSESQGRIVVTVDPKNKEKFEKMMEENSYAQIGEVTKENFIIKGKEEKEIIKTSIDDMLKSYKSTFKYY